MDPNTVEVVATGAEGILKGGDTHCFDTKCPDEAMLFLVN